MRRSYNSRRAWNRPAQPAQPILPNDASLNTPQWDRIMKHPVYNLEQRLGSDIVIPPGWSRELVVQLMKRNMLSAYGSADALEKSLDDVMDTPPERTFGKPGGQQPYEQFTYGNEFRVDFVVKAHAGPENPTAIIEMTVALLPGMPFDAADETHRFELTSMDPDDWEGVVFPPFSTNKVTTEDPDDPGHLTFKHGPQLYTQTQYTATWGVSPYDDLQIRYMQGNEVARFKVPDPAAYAGTSSGGSGAQVPEGRIMWWGEKGSTIAKFQIKT